MSPSGDHYVFDTADPAERRRLDAHVGLWDPCTFRRLAATGIGPAWRCLEVGAGTGSVARWLADQVGPDGLVVATDQLAEVFVAFDDHTAPTRTYSPNLVAATGRRPDRHTDQEDAPCSTT